MAVGALQASPVLPFDYAPMWIRRLGHCSALRQASDPPYQVTAVLLLMHRMPKSRQQVVQQIVALPDIAFEVQEAGLIWTPASLLVGGSLLPDDSTSSAQI